LKILEARQQQKPSRILTNLGRGYLEHNEKKELGWSKARIQALGRKSEEFFAAPLHH
jgi:hypothetical protein